MGLDEEKTVLGDEIVSEEKGTVDPEGNQVDFWFPKVKDLNLRQEWLVKIWQDVGRHFQLTEATKDEDSDPEDEGDEGDDGDDGDDEDEEELEDPLDKVRDTCGEHAECTKLKNELELCNQRVSSRSNTEETCVQELFDFLECQDKCVGHRLFSKLK